MARMRARKTSYKLDTLNAKYNWWGIELREWSWVRVPEPADFPVGDGSVGWSDVPVVDDLRLPEPLLGLGQRDVLAGGVRVTQTTVEAEELAEDL